MQKKGIFEGMEVIMDRRKASGAITEQTVVLTEGTED